MGVRWWAWVPAAVVLSACAAHLPAQYPGAPPRVILVIADGAGMGHWTAARLAADDLAVERFSVVGLVDTRGSTTRVTDSAAGATAFSTGVRTFRGAIGVGPDSVPHRTVLEAAEELGLATGLVTNARVTDASPAAFAAHLPDRDGQSEIARQMASAGLEVLLGGGREFFDGTVPSGSASLLAELRAKYEYIETPAQLRAAGAAGGERPLLGLFAKGTLYGSSVPTPTVPEMAAAALAVLDHDPDGFFLMVENEATDTWAHRNDDLAAITRAMLELDRAIGVALEYQARRPGTLVVVVGDHETGGLTVESGGSPGDRVVAYTTGTHTWEMVPLFAAGPGAERFGGMISNTRVGELLFMAIGAAPGGEPTAVIANDAG